MGLSGRVLPDHRSTRTRYCDLVCINLSLSTWLWKRRPSSDSSHSWRKSCCASFCSCMGKYAFSANRFSFSNLSLTRKAAATLFNMRRGEDL